jgi:hypothetical protein
MLYLLLHSVDLAARKAGGRKTIACALFSDQASSNKFICHSAVNVKDGKNWKIGTKEVLKAGGKSVLQSKPSCPKKTPQSLPSQ